MNPDDWGFIKIPQNFCFEATEEQYEAATKIARDLDRYERKRKIAARIIARQNKELCDMADELERRMMVGGKQAQKISELQHTLEEASDRIADLEARLNDQNETLYQMNDEDNAQRGIIRAYENVIDKLINNK